MAYVDRNLTVSGVLSGTTWTGQSIVGTGNIVSTDSIDLSQQRDIGAGSEHPALHAVIGTAVAGGTSVEIQVITADNDALTTNPTVVGSSGAVPVAQLTAGARFAVSINPQLMGRTARRFLGARYVVTGTTTTGTVVSHFGLDVQDGQRFYASGFAVA
jgi:hypothetical protein